jgi:hypothetical protein
MSNQRHYTHDFRQEESAYVMERWLACQSCSLVGIGSVGKSNLLRHLANPATQAHYMGKETADMFRAIIIDPNLLGSLPQKHESNETLRAWAGYELMMHRLFLAFYPFDILTRDDAERFYDAYQTLQDGTNPLYAYMALRYFELGLDLLLRRGIRVVFMFDEFEELMRQMPITWFHNLRGLRDAHKQQLAYLTFTRAPLKVAAGEAQISAAQFEPFEELFTDSTYFVGPYNDRDAYAMLGELGYRNARPLPDEWSQLLVHLTGGYAGLLRSAYSLTDANVAIPSTDNDVSALANTLLLRSPIRSECKTLWMSLTQPEQVIIKAAAGLSRYDRNPDTEYAVAQLVQKRLLRVRRDTQELEIHPPLFRLYVHSGLEDR